MLFYISIITLSFLIGALCNDVHVCRCIRRASEPYLSSIVFRGDSIDHIRTLSVLDRRELEDVLVNIRRR